MTLDIDMRHDTYSNVLGSMLITGANLAQPVRRVCEIVKALLPTSVQHSRSFPHSEITETTQTSVLAL